jgi:rhodanese-related sulfurtransferase
MSDGLRWKVEASRGRSDETTRGRVGIPDPNPFTRTKPDSPTSVGQPVSHTPVAPGAREGSEQYHEERAYAVADQGEDRPRTRSRERPPHSEDDSTQREPSASGRLLRQMDRIAPDRPSSETAQRGGHIPGAVNIPVAELERRISELDPDREIIAYCRGPYCVYAFEAVASLRQYGFAAHRLADGLPQWRAAGLPVVTAGG